MNTEEHRIEMDILESARRMTLLCQNAESSGIETVVNLADQGEQLENVHSHLTSIDSSLVDTRQNINRMKGLTRRLVGSIRDHFERISNGKLLGRRTHSSNKIKESSVSSRARRSAPELLNCTIPTTMPLLLPHSDNLIAREVDQSLSETQATLQRLKNLALDMNDQLTGQNDTLNQIHDHVIQSTLSIHRQDSAIRNLV